MATAAAASGDHFHGLLGAMRDHYKSGTSTHFALHAMPQLRAIGPGAHRLVGAGPSTGVPPILAGVARDAKAGAQASVDRQQAGAQQAADKVQGDKNADDFMAQMNSSREKAKADSNATIDKAYDSAIELGKDAPPEQQQQILAGMNNIMSTLNSVMTGLVDVLSSLIGMVMDFINGFLKPFEDVAKAFMPIAGLVAML